MASNRAACLERVVVYNHLEKRINWCTCAMAMVDFTCSSFLRGNCITLSGLSRLPPFQQLQDWHSWLRTRPVVTTIMEKGHIHLPHFESSGLCMWTVCVLECTVCQASHHIYFLTIRLSWGSFSNAWLPQKIIAIAMPSFCFSNYLEPEITNNYKTADNNS